MVTLTRGGRAAAASSSSPRGRNGHALRGPGPLAGAGPALPGPARARRGAAGRRRWTRCKGWWTAIWRRSASAQPHGPYWLGGWSAGAVTAYEAARRLREEGEEIALLAIVDGPAPDSLRDPSSVDRVQLFRNFARSTVTGDEAVLDALEAELRALPAEERLGGLSRWITRQGGQVRYDELELVGNVMAVFEATARAVRDYVDPPAIDAPVALFVASEGKAEDGAGPEARPARWRPFVRGEMSVHVIPGVHAQLVLEPSVQPLAAALRQEMERRREGKLLG